MALRRGGRRGSGRGGGANFINIEVPKAMAKDREHAIICKDHHVYPPSSDLWG